MIATSSRGRVLEVVGVVALAEDRVEIPGQHLGPTAAVACHRSARSWSSRRRARWSRGPPPPKHMTFDACEVLAGRRALPRRADRAATFSSWCRPTRPAPSETTTGIGWPWRWVLAGSSRWHADVAPLLWSTCCCRCAPAWRRRSRRGGRSVPVRLVRPTDAVHDLQLEPVAFVADPARRAEG